MLEESAWKSLLHNTADGLKALCKWTMLSILVGLVMGCVGAAFLRSLDWATQLRETNLWPVFLLPLAGAVIALLYKTAGVEKDRGANFVLVAVREADLPPLRIAPLIFICTVLTHLVGGSSGREGAALQLGGSIAAGFERILKLDAKDGRVITMCGMAAGFSALFGTPLTAAIFSIEVISVGVMYYAALLPCVFASLISVQVAGFLGTTPTAFVLEQVPELSPLTMAQAAGIGLLCALLAVIFCRLMHLSPKLYQRLFPNPILRAAAGGGLVLLLTFVVQLWNPGTYDYNGAGGAILTAAIGGQARPEAFLLKILFTMLTLGAGFKGGEIVPVFFTGATFGCVIAPLLGLPASFGAGLGMVSLFCGVTNCPLTSLMLAYEVFGGVNLSLFAAGCAAAYLLSGYESLFQAQKILYSKYRPDFINRQAD